MTVTTTSGDDPLQRYIAALQKMCERSAARAALRTGLRRRPEQAHRMHAYVARFVPPNERPARERAYYTVAALMAAQPRRDESDGGESDGSAEAPVKRRNLGESLAQYVASRPRSRNTDGDQHPIEKRLHLLVRQDVEGVHRDLPALIRQLHAEDVSLDWVQLLRDLLQWPYDRDQVAKRWLQSYYRTLAEPQPTDDADSTEE